MSLVHAAERIRRKVPILNIVNLIAAISYAKVPCCAFATRLLACQLLLWHFQTPCLSPSTGAVRKEDISVGGTACGSASTVLEPTIISDMLEIILPSSPQYTACITMPDEIEI